MARPLREGASPGLLVLRARRPVIDSEILLAPQRVRAFHPTSGAPRARFSLSVAASVVRYRDPRNAHTRCACTWLPGAPRVIRHRGVPHLG